MHDYSLDEICKMITQTVSYLDSIAIWIDRPLKIYELDTLESMCGYLYVPENLEPMPYNPWWRARYLLHQPSFLALEYLNETTGGHYLINHMAIASDFEVDTQTEANIIKEFFRTHQVKLYHGKQEVYVHINTDYSSRRRMVNNNIARYADKLSKPFGNPCCHIEYRIQGSQALRRLGIETIQDVIDFDFLKYLLKHTQLRQINLEKIGRKKINRSRHKKPLIKEYIPGHSFDWYRRVGNIYMRSIVTDPTFPLLCAQKYIDTVGTSSRPYLIKLPTEPLFDKYVHHHFV